MVIMPSALFFMPPSGQSNIFFVNFRFLFAYIRKKSYLCTLFVQLTYPVKRLCVYIVLLFACINLYAAGDAFTINSNGEQVRFAEANLSVDAVLPATEDFHLFGWSGKSRYRVTDFYGIAFVRANDAYAGEFLDWGNLRPVQPDEEPWRTLTADEWMYILKTRPNAANLAGEATIGEQKGFVLLPDTCSLTIAQAVADWVNAQNRGAVFLPYQGYRDGTDIVQEGEVGYYWTASAKDSKQSIYININQSSQVAGNRYLGCSVRLVQPVCKHTIHLHVDDASMGKVIIFKPQ